MIFLARTGRVFGPFSENDISLMRQKGELEQYSWLWNSQLTKWEPVDPPPPPLVMTAEVHEIHQPTPTAPAASQESFKRPRCTRRIEAICHDSQQIVSGVLASISESGCQLVSSSHDSAPVFAPSSALLLNLLDPTTGQSMNVRARFTAASRQAGQWHYRLQWDDYPDLLLG
jgi:hypothetical protein